MDAGMGLDARKVACKGESHTLIRRFLQDWHPFRDFLWAFRVFRRTGSACVWDAGDTVVVVRVLGVIAALGDSARKSPIDEDRTHGK
jgi:hypothetical protein